MCAAFPSRKLSPCRIRAPGLLLKRFVGRSPGQQVSTCFSCWAGINPAVAGGKGKDTFIAESISSVCLLRRRDLWQGYYPRQESWKDLESSRLFSSTRTPGGGKGTCFSGLWAAVARGSWLAKITTMWPGGLAWERDLKCSSGCRGQACESGSLEKRNRESGWEFEGVGAVGNAVEPQAVDDVQRILPRSCTRVPAFTPGWKEPILCLLPLPA